MRTTSKLAALLDLTEVGELRWTTTSDNLGLPQLFGGQLVGQTLMAAGQALGEDKAIHSSYSSFLRAGRHDEPLTLAAEVVRGPLSGIMGTERKLSGRVLPVALLKMYAMLEMTGA